LFIFLFVLMFCLTFLFSLWEVSARLYVTFKFN
jgi:hypothetical protein